MKDQPKSKIHKYLKDFSDINEGKRAVLLATGPTLSDFDLRNIDKLEIDIVCGVKQAIKLPGLTYLDYYFFSDINSRSFPDLLDLYNGKVFVKTKFAITLCDGKNDGRIIDGETASKYFGAFPLEISDTREFTTKIDGFCLAKSSIVFPAVQFLLFTGVTRLYLVGCDCTNYLSFLEPDKQKQSAHKNKFPEGMISMWKKFRLFVKKCYPDVKIISVNPVALKGIFLDIYL